MEPTPEQRRAIETLAPRVCVDAGAGSGKTRVLVEHMIHLLDNGHADLDEIVAVTFTDKAAGEMKERLRSACRGRASVRDPRSMTFWRDIERRVETARVSTIHGFCMAFLKENALSLNMDPDFTILADAEAHLLRAETIETTLHGLLEQNDPAVRRLAIELGVGGRGGLSSVLSALLQRRASLERFRREDSPYDPIVLFETWKQAVKAHNEQRASQLTHSQELRRIRNELRKLDGCAPNPSDKREQLRQEMLSGIAALLNPSTSNPTSHMDALLALTARGGSRAKWSSPEAFNAVKKAFDDLKKALDPYFPIKMDEAVDIEAANLTCDLYTVYETVEGAFADAKTARSSYDFDDLILGALHVLSENPEVRQRTARGIKHLLIDEFQDTDYRQLDIAGLLANEPQGPALFLVGDAKQSIYRFRGAEVEVFGEARDESGEVIPLDKNFRSLPNVLGFVNDFFRRTGQLAAVEPEYGGLVAHRDAIEAPSVEFLLPETDMGEDEAEAAERGDVSAADRRKAEADLIAWRIADLCADSNSYGDVALLFRATSDLYLYESSLRTHDIPYIVVGGAGFYERQEVADIRNLLAVLVEPWDEVALLGLLRSPMVGLSDNALARICEGKRLAEAFNDGHDDEPGGGKRLEDARALIHKLRKECEQPLPAFLQLVLERTGYEAILLNQFLGVQKAANVRKLLNLAEGFARAQTNSLRAFVRYIDEVAAQQIREGEAETHVAGANAVTLMSIHKSKGLEFPTVILPDLSRVPISRSDHPFLLERDVGLVVQPVDEVGERTKPSAYQLIKRIDDEREAAEHARVLYVAMTRAENRLILSGTFAKNIKRSWLQAFDDVYELREREDGEELGGDGWRGVVRRAGGEFAFRGEGKTIEAVPPREALERRVAPVLPGALSKKTISVTGLLEQMVTLPESPAAKPSASGGLDPMKRGSIVHAFFEEWDVREAAEPAVEALLLRECPNRKLQHPLREDVLAAAEHFRQSALGERMAGETHVERETPFLLRIGDALVSGAIDALLQDGTIIDYKTGRRHPGLHARYEFQLRLYAAAIQRLLNKSAPAAYLYYTDLDEQHEVDVSTGAVEEALTRAEEAIKAMRMTIPEDAAR